MSNALYQAAVEALEEHLSPRVVSRSLHEGLRAAGRTPDSVDRDVLDGILKGSVYRQLQVTMPVTQAKKTVTDLLDHLDDVAAGAPTDGTAPSPTGAAEGEPTRDAPDRGDARATGGAAAPTQAAGAPGSSGAAAAETGAAPDADAGSAMAGAAGPSLRAQAAAIDDLRASMRPFNLYFEWPEVQKLRAQVKLLTAEHEAGREAPTVIEEAREQLGVVAQKLEDQLVLQARDLGELADGLERVRSLGGPKIRRLEALMGQVRTAQDERQLAPAEIERARKLVRDLRKLVESSMYREPDAAPSGATDAAPSALVGSADRPDAPAPTGSAAEASDAEAAPTPVDGGAEAAPGRDEGAGPDAAQVAPATPADDRSAEPVAASADPATEGLLDVDSGEDDLLEIDVSSLDPDVSARLLALDLQGEREDVAALLAEHANLLAFRPDLEARAQELLGDLDAGTSIADALADLRGAVATAVDEVRAELKREVEAMEAHLDRLDGPVDATDLRRSLAVTAGILESTLPTHADVEHVRSLYRQTIARAETLAQMEREAASHQQALRAEQDALIERLEATLLRYDEEGSVEPELADLSARLDDLRAVGDGDLASAGALADARRAEEAVERVVASQSTDAGTRTAARIRSLYAQIDGLPTDSTEHGVRVAPVRAELERQLQAARDGTLTSEDLDAVEHLVEDVRHRVRAAYRRRLDGLASRASTMGDTALLDRLRRANDAVDDDVFPDFSALESRVAQAEDAYRAEQREALRALEQRAAGFAGIEHPAYDAFRERVEEIRAQLDGRGTALADVASAERLLDELERRVADRLHGFGGRIDRALVRFERVARLNSDDVATVRRILTHLDSQRGRFERVSIGLRVQLEASLDEAEELIEKLEHDYEATRDIADQLVAGNVIDDVLGLFDGLGAADGGTAAEPADPSAGTGDRTNGSSRRPRASDAAGGDSPLLDPAALSAALLVDDEPALAEDVPAGDVANDRSHIADDGPRGAPGESSVDASADESGDDSGDDLIARIERWDGVDRVVRMDREGGLAAPIEGGAPGGTSPEDRGDDSGPDAGLERVRRSLERLGQPLGHSAPRIATFDTAGGTVLAVWPSEREAILVHVSNPASVDRVRRELAAAHPGLRRFGHGSEGLATGDAPPSDARS